MVVHCLFEQSGTFRDECRKLGYKAYDYDRENQFGKTDFPIDLFREIEKAVNKESSVFDTFTDDDLIITSDRPSTIWPPTEDELYNRPRAVVFPLTSRLVLYL